MTIDCRWCRKTHGATMLCGPARKILDALVAKGAEGDMPSIEFDQPMPAAGVLGGLGLNPEDRLVSQLVVKAALIELAGAQHPALVLTGRDPWGTILPQWIVAPQDLSSVTNLIATHAEIATRRAAQANGATK